MKLYKFINEKEIKKFKGGFVVVDNRIYTNPTVETIKKAGYKELIDCPVPEINPETEYVETTYIENPTTILPMHEVKRLETI